MSQIDGVKDTIYKGKIWKWFNELLGRQFFVADHVLFSGRTANDINGPEFTLD